MKLNSLLAHRITSSARRERCTAINAAAAQNSTTKSRSLTASIEFCVTRGRPFASTKPSSLADQFAVERQRGAGDRAAAERADVDPLESNPAAARWSRSSISTYASR